MLKIILCLIAILILYEIVICFIRKYRRRKIFRLAKIKSLQTGKKLMVVGDPKNGIASRITGSDYDYGDICIDLTGCPDNDSNDINGAIKIKGDICSVIKRFGDNSHVIFISCTLEYAGETDAKFKQLMNDLYRVSGNDLFIVNVEVYSLMAYLYPHYLNNEEPPKRVITRCPPYSNSFNYFRLSSK